MLCRILPAFLSAGGMPSDWRATSGCGPRRRPPSSRVISMTSSSGRRSASSSAAASATCSSMICPRFLANPLEIFAVWNGGMSFHGGFLGTILAMVLFARHRGIPPWCLIDVVAACRPLRYPLWPPRQFHQWRVVWPGHRCSLGNGLSRRRSTAAPSKPALRGSARGRGILPPPATFHPCSFHRLPYPSFVSGVFCIGYGTARVASSSFSANRTSRSDISPAA